MNSIYLLTFDSRILWLGIAAFLITTPTHGAVLNTAATVATNAQEMINDLPASVSNDNASGESADDFPLNAAVEVTSTDLEDSLIAMGHGLSRFEDPARLDSANPQEFALEVACYSNAEDVTYLVNGSADEARTVIFTTPGNPLADPEISFRNDGTREIDSRFFISGAMLIWTPDLDLDDDGLPDRTLDGLVAEVRFTVDHEGTTVPPFDTSLTITGSGSSLGDPDTSGPIVHEFVDLDELANLGVDDASVQILESVAQLGTLTIIVLPQQEHIYRYRVRADESLVLKASVGARIRNVPGGSGIAISIGRPFSELAEFLEAALDGVDGASIENSINRTIKARDVGIVAPAGTNGNPTRAMCGAFGAELYVTLGLLGLACTPMYSKTRRRPAPLEPF